MQQRHSETTRNTEGDAMLREHYLLRQLARRELAFRPAKTITLAVRRQARSEQLRQSKPTA
jgi:hypothetical protein